MPTTINSGILFHISGVAFGDYVFEQNPIRMDIRAPKSRNKIFQTLRGENIYMRPLLDNEVRVMRWDSANVSLFNSLRPFSIPDANGDLPILYFWDGTVNEFQGAAIKVLDVQAEPLVQTVDEYSIQLQFRPWRD